MPGERRGRRLNDRPDASLHPRRELWAVDGGDSEVLRYGEREPTSESVRGIHIREPLPQHQLLQVIRDASERNVRLGKVCKVRAVTLRVADLERRIVATDGDRIAGYGGKHPGRHDVVDERIVGPLGELVVESAYIGNDGRHLGRIQPAGEDIGLQVRVPAFVVV